MAERLKLLGDALHARFNGLHVLEKHGDMRADFEPPALFLVHAKRSQYPAHQFPLFGRHNLAPGNRFIAVAPSGLRSDAD